MAAESTMILSQEELPEVFSDVTPVSQDDGPNPICSIDYSPEFIQAYDYMRAILKTGEKSGMGFILFVICVVICLLGFLISLCVIFSFL